MSLAGSFPFSGGHAIDVHLQQLLLDLVVPIVASVLIVEVLSL